MRKRLPPLLFIVFLLAAGLDAQPRRAAPSIRNPEQLNATEGQRVIAQFRAFRVGGDFIFGIELVHEPYRGDSLTYQGTLSGYAGATLRTRVELVPEGSDDAELKYIQWSRPHPTLWKLDGREDEPIVKDVLSESLFEPLLRGLTFSPFDLMMPYLDWPEFVYEGTRRLRGREVHFFLLYPPAEDPAAASIGGVRVAIDADFNVAVRTETLNGDGTPLRRLDVQSVKKVDSQWIIRRLDMIDLQSRDRTRLVVKTARVGLTLEPGLFTPEGLSIPLPEVPLTSL